jgi:hypothetical protein
MNSGSAPVNEYVAMRFRASELVHKVKALAESAGAVFVCDHVGTFNSPTNIEIRIDHVPAKVAPGDPTYDRSGWTEEEVALGLAMAEAFALAEEQERLTKRAANLAMTPDERRRRSEVETKERSERYSWKEETAPVVDLSALRGSFATAAYLSLFGLDVEVVGYDDGTELAQDLIRNGIKVGFVAASGCPGKWGGRVPSA